MKIFKMSQQDVEQFVIQTGENLVVYGVEELVFSRTNPFQVQEDPDQFVFYEDQQDAFEAFGALAKAGKDCALIMVEFYIDQEGFIQSKFLDNVEEFQFGIGLRSVTAE